MRLSVDIMPLQSFLLPFADASLSPIVLTSSPPAPLPYTLLPTVSFLSFKNTISWVKCCRSLLKTGLEKITKLTEELKNLVLVKVRHVLCRNKIGLDSSGPECRRFVWKVVRHSAFPGRVRFWNSTLCLYLVFESHSTVSVASLICCWCVPVCVWARTFCVVCVCVSLSHLGPLWPSIQHEVCHQASLDCQLYWCHFLKFVLFPMLIKLVYASIKAYYLSPFFPL